MSSPKESRLLAAIREHPGKSFSGLIRLTRMPLGTLRATVERLVEQGHVVVRLIPEPGHNTEAKRCWPVQSEEAHEADSE